jgi:hypothetical protein
MGTYDTRGGTPRHDPAADCDAFGNRSTFICQFWTEDGGWEDSEMEFDTVEEAEDWCRDRPHWRYYDALEAHYASVEAEMAADAERASSQTPECGCEWGCRWCEESAEP